MMKCMVKAVLCLAAFFAATSLSAQSRQLTSKQVQFRAAVQTYLSSEGFRPTIDKDGSLNWKSEGNLYWLNVYGEDPFYVEMHHSGYGISDEDRGKLLEACNHVNLGTQCVKASLGDTSILITCEVYCKEPEYINTMLYNYMKAMHRGEQEVKKAYNGETE